MAVRRQLSWINTALPATARKYAGWDVSGNPAVKDLTTAAANELAKSNGSDSLIPSGIFSLPSNGNLQLGSASIGGDRTIEMISASAASSLNIVTKGVSGSVVISAANILALKSGSTPQFAAYNSSGGDPSSWNNVFFTGPLTQPFVVRGGVQVGAGDGGELVIQGGGSAAAKGGLLTIQGGPATADEGGDILIEAGIGGTADGNITINVHTGELIFLNLPTAAGGPSGSAYWNGNVLTRNP